MERQMSSQKKNITGQISNSAILSYFQVGSYNIKEEMILNILNSILHEKVFNQIRTKEQLGYIVGTRVLKLSGVSGFLFIVQSGVKEPVYLDNRIENFIQEIWKEELFHMNKTELDQYKESVQTDLTKPPNSLSDLSSLFWNEITTRDFLFNRSALQLTKLNGTDMSDLITFCVKYLFDVTTRRRLSIHVVGDPALLPSPASFPQKEIMDIGLFKKNSELYSIPAADSVNTDPTIYNVPASPSDPTLTTPSQFEDSIFPFSGLTLGMMSILVIIILVVVISIVLHYGKFQFGTPQGFQEPDDDLSEDFFYDDENENSDNNLLSNTNREDNNSEDEIPEHDIILEDDL